MKPFSLPHLIIVAVVMLATLSAPTGHAADLHVPAQYATIQAAIDAAVDTDQVIIADGTYTGTGNVNLDTLGKAITVGSQNGPENCIIDCENLSRGFVFQNSETPDTIIEGLTVVNGYHEENGGGLLLTDSVGPTLNNCIFLSNQAPEGGAVSATSSTAIFTQCQFMNNAADNGGAVHETGCENNYRNCTFSGNSAEMAGGGIFFNGSSDTIVSGAPSFVCRFENNKAGSGADLCVTHGIIGYIDVEYSSFQGHDKSSFWINNTVRFKHDYCQFDTTPILQDVYISPTGNDSNDGLTPATPFKTISHALKLIGSGTTINLAPGVYSSQTNGEILPLHLLNNVTLSGAGMGESIIDGNNTHRLLTTGYNFATLVRDLTCRNGYHDVGGGAARVQKGKQVVFDSVEFLLNETMGDGGAIQSKDTNLYIFHCVFQDNTAANGGAMAIQGAVTWVYNCLLTANSAEWGGAVYSLDSHLQISTDTFADNMALNDGGAFWVIRGAARVFNSIIWGNTPNGAGANGLTYLDYCNFQDGVQGAGCISVDPLFVSGPAGDYYLSQSSAGDVVDSPCLDRGSRPVEDLEFNGRPIDILTTRGDERYDRGVLDMGYHYPSSLECSYSGCRIIMPRHFFSPGATCYCHVKVCNTESQAWNNCKVFAILDMWGTMFFAPGFTGFDYYELTIPPGATTIEVLPEFTWPETPESASDIYWYAAVTDAAVTEIWGEMDSFEFRYF